MIATSRIKAAIIAVALCAAGTGCTQMTMQQSGIRLSDLASDTILFSFQSAVSPEVYRHYPYDITYSTRKIEPLIFESKVRFGRPMGAAHGDNMDIPGYVLNCSHAAIARAHGYPYWTFGLKQSEKHLEFDGSRDYTLYLALLADKDAVHHLNREHIDFLYDAMDASTDDVPLCQDLFVIHQ